MGYDSRGAEARVQGVHREPYWSRAISEGLNPNEVLDQQVLRDSKQWCESPSAESNIVAQLCDSEEYVEVWNRLAELALGGAPERILLLTQHVLSRVMREQGRSAAVASQGLLALHSYATRFVRPAWGAVPWLKDRLTEAASVSLRLLHDIRLYWGSDAMGIVQSENAAEIQTYLIRTMQEHLKSGDDLCNIVNPTDSKRRFLLHDLFLIPVNRNQPDPAPFPSWWWLGNVLLDALRSGSAVVALETCDLVQSRNSAEALAGHEGTSPNPEVTKRIGVNYPLLRGFFGDRCREAIDALGAAAKQFNGEERRFMEEIVQSAKAQLASEGAASE
jgi:hypothetical protein